MNRGLGKIRRLRMRPGRAMCIKSKSEISQKDPSPILSSVFLLPLKKWSGDHTKDLTLYTLTLRTLHFILDGGAFLHYKFHP